ncbi:hypothetical protein ACFQ6S_13115 [Streptomyces sp. NPDC056479]|uniref:hypothetical protein n=1 Tax=Streptomyces sp. NPDC056479 TaxID=3345832 RepID=UPI0036953222
MPVEAGAPPDPPPVGGRTGAPVAAARRALFFVDSAEQRPMGVKDSHDLAWQDWLSTGGCDRGIDDPFPRRLPLLGPHGGAGRTAGRTEGAATAT